MHGQSSPVQAKDLYTGSNLIHVGSSCKHTKVYNVHLPRIIKKKILMGVTRKQNNHLNFFLYLTNKKRKNKKRKRKKKRSLPGKTNADSMPKCKAIDL